MTARHIQNCSVIGFLDLFGDAWTLLVVREAFLGTTRFSDFQRNTGAAKNLLSDRLTKLVDHGILEKVDIGTSGQRFAYHITPKGESLKPLLTAIIVWSNEHLYPQGTAPTVVINRETGEQMTQFNAALGMPYEQLATDFKVVAGPGASRAARKRFGS